MLYFVSTPIGNLEDISLRAINTLKKCDIIACEDTRHSKILLDHYEIKAKTIAYHKFNEQNSADGIISLLKEGKNVAIISDAGMPVISDPGNILAKKLIENNIKFTIIPGANAGLSALILSGFDATKFAFYGFLSEKNKELKSQLVNIKNFNGTKIIYSSKYNLNKDLSCKRTILSTLKNGKYFFVQFTFHEKFSGAVAVTIYVLCPASINLRKPSRDPSIGESVSHNSFFLNSLTMPSASSLFKQS